MRREFGRGRPATSARIQAALRLIAEFSQSDLAARVDLQEIDISTPQVLAVTTRLGSRITVGYEDLGAQLQRWRIVHDYAFTTAKEIATLDLSVSNNVPARWQEAASVLSVQPRNLKLSRYKKKHV